MKAKVFKFVHDRPKIRHIPRLPIIIHTALNWAKNIYIVYMTDKKVQNLRKESIPPPFPLSPLL